LEVFDEIAKDMSALFRTASYLMFDGERDIGLTTPLADPAWCTIAVAREKHSQP
jgi:hypothetical protein